MSSRSFWHDVLIESEFKKLKNSTYVFGSPNRFVLPYIVTEVQKEKIARQVLWPARIAMFATLFLGIAATVLSKSTAVLLSA